MEVDITKEVEILIPEVYSQMRQENVAVNAEDLHRILTQARYISITQAIFLTKKQQNNQSQIQSSNQDQTQCMMLPVNTITNTFKYAAALCPQHFHIARKLEQERLDRVNRLFPTNPPSDPASSIADAAAKSGSANVSA